jgi:hypothetical protein
LRGCVGHLHPNFKCTSSGAQCVHTSGSLTNVRVDYYLYYIKLGLDASPNIVRRSGGFPRRSSLPLNSGSHSPIHSFSGPPAYYFLHMTLQGLYILLAGFVMQGDRPKREWATLERAASGLGGASWEEARVEGARCRRALRSGCDRRYLGFGGLLLHQGSTTNEGVRL